MLSYSHDERTQLKGADREFAKTGNLVFTNNGKTYRSQNYSASSIPANVLDDAGNLINPDLIATGVCAPNTFRVTDGADDFCGFDYVSTLEIYPERKRDAAMGSLTARVGAHDLFADLLWSRTSQVSRIAPVPGALADPCIVAAFAQYLAPLGITADTLAFYRVADLGKRTNDDKADFFDLALGSKGSVAGWDYSATYSHSESDVKGNISGYPGGLALSNLRASGLLNPFVGPGQQTPAAQAALDGINYKGYWDGGVAKLDTFSLQSSNEIGKMGGGAMMLALGADYRVEKFQSKPSPFAQGITTNPVTGELCDPNDPLKPCDQRFGDASASVPYSADRNLFGLYGELLLPIVKGLETTAVAALRQLLGLRQQHDGQGQLPLAAVCRRAGSGLGRHRLPCPERAAAQCGTTVVWRDRGSLRLHAGIAGRRDIAGCGVSTREPAVRRCGRWQQGLEAREVDAGNGGHPVRADDELLVRG